MEKKILVVDDDEVVLYMYQRAFAAAGFHVSAADSAEGALQILESERGIHVMFFDLNLPGMSGEELCREVRRKNSIAIIYAVTGYTSVFEFAACRKAGFDDYFKKPVDVDRLIQAAEDAFEKLHRWME